MARSNTNGMGRRAVGRRGQDRQINSGNRPTMGTGFYTKPVDAPSASEFRAGMVVPSHNSKGEPIDPAVVRKRTKAQTTLGARYHISPNVNAVVQPDTRTLTSSRIVPPAIGTRRNFWAQGRSYGAAI